MQSESSTGLFKAGKEAHRATSFETAIELYTRVRFVLLYHQDLAD